MITVIQERHIKPGKQNELKLLLRQLRLAAMNHPGFVTGETLVNADDPNHHIVIGNFKSVEDWKRWEGDAERREIASRIQRLMSKPAKITICDSFNWTRD